jgi:hypothetical protein
LTSSNFDLRIIASIFFIKYCIILYKLKLIKKNIKAQPLVVLLLLIFY